MTATSAADGCRQLHFRPGAGCYDGCPSLQVFFELMSVFVSKCEPSCAAVGTGSGKRKVHCGMASHKEIRMNATLASAWECTHLAARGALVALALTACGQSTDGASQSPATVSDTATAY